MVGWAGVTESLTDLTAMIHAINTLGIGALTHRVPVVNGSVFAKIAQVRFKCIRVTLAVDPAEDVYLRQFSLHKKIVPWEQS